jgi:hypothetical protein
MSECDYRSRMVANTCSCGCGWVGGSDVCGGEGGGAGGGAGVGSHVGGACRDQLQWGHMCKV